MAAAAWGGNQFTPLLVMYRQEQGFSATVVYLLLATYVLGIVPTVLVAGRLSDRLGRRAVFAPAPAVAILGSAVLATGASSVPLLATGRVLSGIGVGLAMAVGTTWIKELSGPPWDPAADAGAAARRASVGLTAGFLLGAAAAGAVAQWAPWPTRTPYAVHIALTVPAAVWVRRSPETRRGLARSTEDGGPSAPAPLPASAPGRGSRPHGRGPRPGRRFVLLIVPAAPWVFGTVGVAYAVLPNVVAGGLGGVRIAYSALATVVTLGSSVLAQPLIRKVHRPGSAGTQVAALLLAAAGMALGAVAAATPSALLALGAAVVLGVSYGTNLVSGLLDVHRTTPPDDLAQVVALFYALTYVGFAAPVVMALLEPHASYPTMLATGALVALATAAWVHVVGRSPVAVTADR